MDFKLFTKCDMCRKKRLYISKREVPLPTGHKAKSQKLMCGKCFKVLIKALNIK